MSVFRSEKTWRVLTNLWTTVFILFVIFNFFAMNEYEFMILPFSVIYIGVLGLYVGTKEFDRWYDVHKDRHPGEWFVLMWTVVIVGLLGAQIILGKDYKLSSEAGAVYIMVLSVFALTRKSKQLHERKNKGDNDEDSSGIQPPPEGQLASSVSLAGLGSILREYGKLVRIAAGTKAKKDKVNRAKKRVARRKVTRV